MTPRPGTQAGRALLAWFDSDARPLPEYGWDTGDAAILAIEHEVIERAVAAADDVRYGGGILPDYWRGYNDGIDKYEARLRSLEEGK